MQEPLISVENALCRIAKGRVLAVDAFTLLVGQHWCIFGGNGAGKTSFLSLLCGQFFSARAHVKYGAEFDPAVIEVVSFEEQQRLWALDARHDISEYSSDAQDQGTTVARLVLGCHEPDTRYLAILEQLRLTPFADRGIRFLSSGQMRKAQIARALYLKPPLLVLDEPLESIDHRSQQEIVEALSAWMTPHTASILICRRAQDILPSVTHLLLMDDLQITGQGDVVSMCSSAEFINFIEKEPLIPLSLPVAVKSHLSVLDPREPLVELKNVSASYGENRVIEGLSWTMRAKHHTLIEGPNGCGKSTLLSLIDGDNHKAYGQDVFLFGRKRGSGETVWEVKARFGVVSNEIHNKYVKSWRVLDVVVSGFFDSVGLFDDSGASERESALQWLGAFGLQGLETSYFNDISYGQQRLALLARAMVKYPRILILDEPCVGLDDYHRRLLLGIVDRIAALGSVQIIFVSHQHDDVPSCINQRLVFAPTGIVVEDCLRR